MPITILEDTRQKLGKHLAKHRWWQEHEVVVVRSKLPFGDYALMFSVVVDTKQDILELCNDIDQQHERFRRECIAARNAGCLLVILVENFDGVTDLATLARWKNPRRFYNRIHGLRKPMSGKRLAKACATMRRKYGVRFKFCRPEESGRRVMELLNVRF